MCTKYHARTALCIIIEQFYKIMYFTMDDLKYELVYNVYFNFPF